MRCQTCDRFPFCKREDNNGCDKWIKRNAETKLNKIENGYYEFERIDK